MKNTKVFALCVVIALVAGYMLGGFSASTSSKRDIHNLKKTISRRNTELKKIQADGVLIEKNLKAAHDTVVLEKIKYEKIEPVTYSLPELDSFFRARYEK